MFIVIKHYESTLENENGLKLIGTYSSYSGARHAMVKDASAVRDHWAEVDTHFEFVDVGSNIELYDGISIDYDSRVKWVVFDTDNPIEYRY